MRRTTFALLAVVAAVCSCLFAASVAGAQAPAASIQALDSQAWQPPNVTVSTGETVRWTFTGTTLPHNVHSTSANWNVQSTVGSNQAPQDFTFTAPGTYTFQCDVHGSSMTGTVTVEDPGADPLENVLVFYKVGGFPHTSRDEGVTMFQELGAANDFNVVATDDAAAFTTTNLANFDAVVFLSTTGEVLNDEQQDAFEDYIQGGGGYVGIHSATDTEYAWPWYGQMLGGYFRNHPAGTPSATVNITDGDEPSTQGLPTNWARVDEWYNFQGPTNPVVNGGGTDYSPRNSGVKVLATIDEATYEEDDGNTTNDDHPVTWCSDFDGGHMWYTALGHTEASYSEANFRQHVLGGLETVTGAEPADCGEPRQATPTADDFEMVTIDDDTESPMELTVANDGRVFYVERVTGEINVYNPVNGQVTTAVTLPVSSVLENGGIGLQLAPDFDTSNQIYVAYTPLPNTNNQSRVSRFTVGANNTIALSSEQIIFQWTAQRETCCHSGGSLAFGANGDLYLSTGDNTNPFESDGFNPIDERPNRQNFDAQRTSANSNNHNGKILRIHPIPNATGVPGIGTTYTIPSGNMFAPGTPQTLPEIYAMGFRNPFRITIDPHTGWVLVGNYGPDAATGNPNRGPQGSVEFEVVKQPGFYGWPYCVRDNVPYNDYNFANSTSGPKFNCADLTNDSPNNTGIQDLPPAIPATMWLGYSDTDPRVPGLGAGGAPTGGPRYEFDPDLNSATKFPEYYDEHWFIGEWNNGWLRTATLNANGDALGVFRTPWEDTFQRPHEIEFGPDGALYVIDWGTGFNGNNIDSGIYRIDYVAGERRPIAHATSNVDNGPTPLTVNFSSDGSIDPDGTSLTYAWDFDGNGTIDSTDANPSHTYNTAGTFNATLTVTDADGQTGFDTIPITAGNTRPVVTITVPEDGQFAAFGDIIPYEITVTDAEDGTVDCQDVTLSWQLGHDEHAHGLGSQQGCSGTFRTSADSGHGANANIFTSVVATYTDEAQGAAGALTGSDDLIIQPKPKQAEFFTSTGRTGSNTGGTPGVQTEATTDAGGGTNIGFTENGDYVSYNPVNLEELTGLRFRVASGGAGGNIEVRLDSPTGDLVGTAAVANTGGWQNWVNVDLPLPTPPSGTHQMFLVFNNPTAAGTDGLLNLNYFTALGKGAANSDAPQVSADAEPRTGAAPLEVHFTGTATDPDGGAGATLTYKWDFGVAGTSDDTSTEKDPTYTYQRAGTYNATFTATDADGAQSSATVQVVVTAGGDCPENNLRSDEFDGDAIDMNRWNMIRPDATRAPSVSGGNLNFPIDNGSLYGPGTSARNILVQDLPTGAWEVTSKITVDPLTENYQQAGLRIYSGDNDWASIHMIYAGTGRDFEFIYEDEGIPRNEAADKLGGIPADAPTTYYVRLASDGTDVRAYYSYDGTTFSQVGRPAPISTLPAPKIGPAALSDQAATFPVAHFDWIRFNPDEPIGGGGGGSFVDEFDGAALGAGWDVVRQDQTLTVSGSKLNIPAQTGDIYGGSPNDAKNLVMRAAPSGPWVATTKMNFKGAAQYHQAGLVVYGDDDNFTKFGRIATNALPAAASEKFEYIYENAASPRNDAADSTAPVAAGFPDDVWMRITSDGTNITGAYSTDGNAWTPVGRPAPLPANAKIGMFSFSNMAATAPVAAFDSFTLTGDNVGGGTAGPSRDDDFAGAALDKTRWNAIVRDTPASYAVSGGNLTITTEPGDIYTNDTVPPPNNFILQSADHAGADWVIETKIDSAVNGGYGQGGLIAMVDGNNYVKLDPIADAGQTRINRIELRTEIAGTPTGPASDPQIAAGTGTVFWLRLTKAGNSYTGEYSRDGVAWSPAGVVTNPMTSPAFGLFAFGPQADGQGDTVAFDSFTLDGEDPDQPCECTGGSGDEFDSGTLDKTKFNAIVREDSTKYTVQDGQLNVTTVNGDIYTNSDSAPTRNFFLQTADHAGPNWVIETKVNAIELSGGYEQAGLLARVDDDNYVKFDILSDDGQTALNRIELRSEVAGAIVNPQPQLTPLPANDGNVWLRLSKTGTDYKGEYSFDGTTFTAFATVPNAMAEPSFGLFTLGVTSGGGTAHFDYLEVDGERGCEEPPPDNQAPQIQTATADPTIGFAPLPVQFTGAATDPDAGDTLTYDWDFGDGTAHSTDASPTHTYTTPGEKVAKLTVSDGEATATRNVPVNVLEPDNAQARFRVLVFSKTAGFRHSSITPGHPALEKLGTDNNFQVDHTEDGTAFRDDILSHYDTVIWLSTTGDVLNDTQQAAFERYIEAGGGYTGIHSAADTEYTWAWYGQLVGAYFRNHPVGTLPNGGRNATVHVEDTTDHSTQGLPTPNWDRADEWYNYQSPVNPSVGGGGTDYSPRATVHVLTTVDESTYDEDDGNTTDDDHPISWCKRYDGGRSWYTGMGHTDDSFTEANYLKHILGGIEVSAGVAPSAECGTTATGAPVVQGFADPPTGTAPLQVQFSSTAADPDGDALSYKWEFGDGSSSLSQAPLHTYTTPGVYTAKVTVKDPAGHTGTDTVQVTVNAPGNMVPLIQNTAADPTSGNAPLDVHFQADAIDPDGPENQLVYRWDFGDGGAQFGADVHHTYMQPGTYKAKVKVTDAGGASTTSEEITITVANPPGNAAPSVEALADPTSGTAPLRVRFTSSSSDPDGDQLLSVWDFGDGVKAGGDAATHTYTQPGTYNAKVTVTDPGGKSASSTVQVVVRAVTGAGSETVQPSPDTGDVAGETQSRPLVRLTKNHKVARVLKRGLRYKVSCEARCRVSSVLRIAGGEKQRLGASRVRVIAAGRSGNIVLKLDRQVRRNLVRAMRKAHVRNLKATVVLTVRTADGTTTLRKRVVLAR